MAFMELVIQKENQFGVDVMKQKSYKVNFINILLILIFLAGMGILLYPNISDYFNQKNSSKAIATYDEQLAQIKEEEREEIISDATQYNYDLMQDAGRFSGTQERHEAYEAQLNVDGKGMMGYLKIPKLNVDVPIYHTTDESVLESSVGHVEGTSLPIGGVGSHAALSAHTGLPSAILFTNLEKMQEGDTFSIFIMGEEHKYLVDQIKVVLPGDTSDLAIDPNEDYVTLITCTPYGVNTHRLLVRGKRVDLDDEAAIEAESATMNHWTREQIVNAVAVGFAASFGLLLFFILPAQVRKGGLRPWDETISDVMDSSKVISELATRENWEALYVAQEADWLGALRPWNDRIFEPWYLADKDFEKARTYDTGFDDVEVSSDALDEHQDYIPKKNYSLILDPKLRFKKDNFEYREWDEDMADPEADKNRDWDDDILDKVTQNWKQINAKVYKEATNYIGIEELDTEEENPREIKVDNYGA